ncbi:MAG: hypothetical protein KGI80_00330 [Verrucomicrobiota bacterium]|nr:hypothetical protein [Verrucomicrobiota bacterium]
MISFATPRLHISETCSYIRERVATLTQRVSEAASYIFRILQEVLYFPLRYRGPKPGTAPEESSYKNPSKEELEQYLPYACAAAYIWNMNPKIKLPGLENVPLTDVLSEETLKTLGVTIQEKTDDGNKVWYFLDEKTELSATLLTRNNEWILAFGALGAVDRKKGMFSWATVALSILGFNPKLFQQADKLTAAVCEKAKQEGKSLTLVGHCYGAALAGYAALRNDQPAVRLNPFPLGAGQQHYIGTERLQNATKQIINIRAEGDFLDWKIYSHLDNLATFLRIRTPGNFGCHYRIPSAKEYVGSSDKCHGFILGSIMENLGHNCRTLPCNITQTEFPSTL